MSTGRIAAGALMLLVLAGAAPASTPAAAKGTPMTAEGQASAASPHERSRQYAQRIRQLPQHVLPDEWYPAKGATVAERFQNAFKAMPAGAGKPASVAELMARYDNQGLPIAHAVWFNRPLRCRQCNEGGADGFTTVLSVRLGLVVTITALEMHEALQHQGRLPDDKLATLDKLFAPATPTR